MSTLATIHVAKRQLGLDEDAFRDALELATQKRSLRAMTEAERLQVVAHFKERGFVFKPGKGGRTKKLSNKKYVRLIYALWRSCAELGVIEDKSKWALRVFVGKRTEAQGERIDDPEFLTYDQASPIIETLKSMEQRGRDQAQ